MGSIAAIAEGGGDRYQMSKDEEPVPEGIEGRVPYKGELNSYMNLLFRASEKEWATAAAAILMS
jgi:IMP dehydrogenase